MPVPGGLRQFEIGAAVLLSKYNVSRLLDRLEKEKLLERYVCEEDGRGAHVYRLPPPDAICSSACGRFTAQLSLSILRSITIRQNSSSWQGCSDACPAWRANHSVSSTAESGNPGL